MYSKLQADKIERNVGHFGGNQWAILQKGDIYIKYANWKLDNESWFPQQSTQIWVILVWIKKIE